MCATHQEQARHRIGSWLRDKKNLPPVPMVVQEALALLDDQGAGSADIARVVGRDEAITAKILRVVNSAFYGLPGRVNTLSHAVALLGFEQVRLLILGVALFESGEARDPIAAANRKIVWQHSFACAGWAQALAREMRYQRIEEAYIGALLHDVGKVILAVSAPREFAAVVELAKQKAIPVLQAERAAIGIDHVEVGVLVSERWRFPSIYHNCIALHHTWPPRISEDQPGAHALRQLLAIVRVADSASYLFTPLATDGEEVSIEPPRPPEDPQALGSLLEQIDDLLADVQASKNEP